MTTSTTRARTGRDARSPGPRREVHDAPVQGANALQIGYADPEIADTRTHSAPEAPARRRHRPRVQPTTRPATRPTTVTPPAAIALPRAPFLLLVVGIVIVGVLGVLVLNTKINENSFALEDLRAQQHALDLREQQLSRDLEEAQSPGNLRAAAKRLGLVPGGTPAYITLPDGKVVGVPTPATAANPASLGR